MSLEPIRKALSSEPLLALSAGAATLACDATELVFVDASGVQRLTLREIRKVTHVEGHLVVTSSDDSIRGSLNVSSGDLKAFFADLQTLRKRRDAGLAQPLESRFKPAGFEQSNAAPLEKPGLAPLTVTGSAPLTVTGSAPLTVMGSAPLERITPLAPQIPGFSIGLSAAPAEVSLPRVSPATMSAPRAEPIPAAPIPVAPIAVEPSLVKPSQTPAAPPIEDLLQYQLRPAKPNPRAPSRSEREELPPPKPNPRAAAIQSPLAEPAAFPQLDNAPVNVPPHESRPAALEQTSSVALEKPSVSSLEGNRAPVSAAQPEPRALAPQQPHVARPEPRAAPLEKPGSSALGKPRVTVPTRPRAAARALPSLNLEALNLERFKLERLQLDLPTLWQRSQSRFKPRLPDSRFHLRRAAASAIDAALSLILMWLATRIVGGRELETLLRLPGDTRADLSMLESLKDLLPLFIAGALSGVLIALAAGLLYAVISELSPLRGTPGRHFMGLRLTLLSGARVSLAVIAGRYLVNIMLLLVPSVLGLLPTLIALSGPAIALRSSLQLFGLTTVAGLIVLLIGQLPVYGANRAQTLADYLTDCILRDAPKAAPLETSKS